MLSPPSDTDEPLFPASATWLLLAALALMFVPLFVCSPVTSDVSLFDVQAMTVLNGGVLYRDVLEPNLPGIVWIHVALRSVVGWSSEAIRAFDLVVFAAVLFTFCKILWRTNGAKYSPHLFVFTAFLFYVTRNEWCHCQRDSWMMLPVSLAMLLRTRRTLTGGTPAMAEGVFWAIAFWIKPHVAIPALAVFAVETLNSPAWKMRLVDLLFVVAGGVVAAIPGLAWLIKSGAWPHFWEMAFEWNPEYVAVGRERQDWSRLSQMLQRFSPWWSLHLIAVPVGIRNLVDSVRSSERHRRVNGLLPALYLTWLVQSHVLQHAMDYIHVPEYLLAMTVIASHRWTLDLALRRVTVAAMLLLALVGAPQFYGERLNAWTRCFREGSSHDVRSILAQGNMPDWQHLDNVRNFLKTAGIRDGELTCLNGHSIHLHKELHILPATRYWCVTHPLTLFPSHGDEIMKSVEHSGHRFVVVDAVESAQPNQILPRTFPNQYPIVFKSGPYQVHAIRPADASAHAAADADVAFNVNQQMPGARRLSDTK